ARRALDPRDVGVVEEVGVATRRLQVLVVAVLSQPLVPLLAVAGPQGLPVHHRVSHHRPPLPSTSSPVRHGTDNVNCSHFSRARVWSASAPRPGLSPRRRGAGGPSIAAGWPPRSR